MKNKRLAIGIVIGVAFVIVLAPFLGGIALKWSHHRLVWYPVPSSFAPSTLDDKRQFIKFTPYLYPRPTQFQNNDVVAFKPNYFAPVHIGKIISYHGNSLYVVLVSSLGGNIVTSTVHHNSIFAID